MTQQEPGSQQNPAPQQDPGSQPASAWESFSAWMRERSAADWEATTDHPFARALLDGAVPAPAMRTYLVQDYQFIDVFLALLGTALAKADRYSSRLAIAGAITVVTSAENTYFERAFDALDVPEQDRVAPELDAPTRAFRELMSDTGERGGYAEALTVLTVAEWSYLDWAQHGAPPSGGSPSSGNPSGGNPSGGNQHVPRQPPADPIQAEWIELHNNAEFRQWVQWLRAELDRVGAQLDERDRARCLRLFQRATRCERDFFDAHWPG